MQTPHDLIPMYITLTGARDRAKHEQKKVGNVYCRATTEIALVGIVDAPPSDVIQKRIALIQRQAQTIINHTIGTMARDIAFLLDNDGAAMTNVSPNGSVSLLPENSPELEGIRAAFINDIQTDTEACEALSNVTAKIVAGWQG